ncbi:tRNA (guanine(26)-N(2))-dimethyltransferase-like isoform X1 [Macrosteles quadrilineatus]|uniref:tRNA (guanine(26)-N(2))-dimethyltransferase-like isoform X1 n=1 Tax=Macrosteles quadrilineatus TaxID=74068 RepID=UPI0023E32DA2|nr:tRNA (guanine(26)-N(2))-dimethyltransferase-like isoform X1 [Macrosteles quadrilineatus]
MSSPNNDLDNSALGLEKSEPLIDDSRHIINKTTTGLHESSETQLSNNAVTNSVDKVSASFKSKMSEVDSDINVAEKNDSSSEEAMQLEYHNTSEDCLNDNMTIDKKKLNINDGDDNSAEPTVSEDDNLLSEISKLVDQQHGDSDSQIVSESDCQDNNVEKDDAIDMESNIDEVNNDVEGNSEGKLDSAPQDKVGNTLTSEIKKPKESAVQRLASLGLIPEEKPVVEDKETILKKLASRGGISIVPAGSRPSPSSSPVSVKPVSSNVSPTKQVTSKTGSVKPSLTLKPPVAGKSQNISNPSVSIPTPVKPIYKPGPKSAKKKIKIDPGNSLDIEKDFNSLINILSTGADVSSTSVTSSTGTTEEKSVSGEIVSEKVNESKLESQLEMNEASNQSTNDGHVSGMDVDTNDDKTFESETESHDDSKLDQCSETDEKDPSKNKNKNVIEEGSAEILLIADKNVFYNKVQEFNRDMSIAALTVFSEMHQQDPRIRNRGIKRKANDSSEADSNHAEGTEENVFEAGKKAENGITILEALSATGLRSIRYAREIPGVKEVIANDFNEDAVETIKKNVEHNMVEDMVTTSMSDASLLMYQRKDAPEGFDVIDLDPYGCPSRFLDAAVQAVRDGGLLLVTCTDMAILAGNSPESCYVKYGAVSLRMPACHEMGLRIALQCIESHANRYGRYIVPLLSFSADFYIRLIVQIYTSPVTCKKTTSKLAMVYQCVGCGTHSFHPLGSTSQVGHNSQPKFSLTQGPPVGTNCFHCNHKHNMGGPIWTNPIYSTKFVESMLQVLEKGRFGTAKRMQGMLEVIREELQDVPLYYTISGLCTKLHCQAIPLIDIRSAILNAGYRVSASHAAPTAIKTNAPSKIIWDIMRCWVHMNPVSEKRLVPGSVAAAIILEPPNLIANFDIHPRARPSSAIRKLVRYQQNPEKNWGPGTRARCNPQPCELPKLRVRRRAFCQTIPVFWGYWKSGLLTKLYPLRSFTWEQCRRNEE